MALSREEVNRRLAEAAEAQRGQVHQMAVNIRLSEEQLDELLTVDPQGRRDRAREMVAMEGRPWNREMTAQLERLNDAEAMQRTPGRPATLEGTRSTADRDRQVRGIAVPLDDLNGPPPKP